MVYDTDYEKVTSIQRKPDAMTPHSQQMRHCDGDLQNENSVAIFPMRFFESFVQTLTGVFYVRTVNEMQRCDLIFGTSLLREAHDVSFHNQQGSYSAQLSSLLSACRWA